jgi:hypothetical protein
MLSEQEGINYEGEERTERKVGRSKEIKLKLMRNRTKRNRGIGKG